MLTITQARALFLIEGVRALKSKSMENKQDDLLGKNPHRRAVTKKPFDGNQPRKREEDLDDSL